MLAVTVRIEVRQRDTYGTGKALAVASRETNIGHDDIANTVGNIVAGVLGDTARQLDTLSEETPEA